jgi:threonine dehydratase
MIPIDRVVAAARRAEPHVLRTPVIPLGSGRVLKLECLQPTGSFKVRGFFAAALALPPRARARGLLTVSAGNAAQAAAYVAHTLGIPCRVWMYDTAPETKTAGVRRWGGEPVQRPRQEILDWIARRGWESEPEVFIHPFADEELMAGHGGLGLELLEQVPDLTQLLVPVGGGGLISGVASALKGRRPQVEVIGVQSDGYPLWPRTFAEGHAVTLAPHTIADGTTAPFDARMFERLKTAVDRWLVVPEKRLRRAVAELALTAKVVAEGAGALAYAALEQLPADAPAVAVVSGGNLDGRLLAELLAEPS